MGRCYIVSTDDHDSSEKILSKYTHKNGPWKLIWGKRAGTENVAGIVGLAKASQISHEKMNEFNKIISDLRDSMYEKLRNTADVKLNDHPTQRLPNTLNVSFRGVDSTELVSRLEGIALSTGSVCHYNSKHPSAVLTAMHVPVELALGAVRFSLGRFNTKDEVGYVVGKIQNVINEIKKET